MYKRLSLLIALLALAACQPPAEQSAEAETAAPAAAEASTSQPAASGERFADVDIEFSQFRLDNGLTVIIHEDRKAPIASVNIWYHVGSKNEVPGKTGFAHLFEHLMFQGSENFDGEHLALFDEVGASERNGTTWFDRTNYFETVPVSALDTMLWMEADRMGYLLGAIDQAKLDEQRGVVQNEKRQGENQPYGKVFERILPQVFPAPHPYSWETIGSMEDLNAATLDDVKEWFRTYYGPNNAVLVVAGDVDTEEALERVKYYFDDIKPGPPLTKTETWIPRHTEVRREAMQDRVSQARLYMAWPGPQWGSRDSHELSLAASILASGKNSRLYERLVYRDQIATDVAIVPYDFEIAGITYLQASVRDGHTLAEVEAAVREEFDRFFADGPTQDELNRVKAQIESSFIRGVELIGGRSGKSAVLARSMVYGGSPDAYRIQLDNIGNATTQSVRAAAQEWLGGGEYVLEVSPFPSETAVASSVDRSIQPPLGEDPAVTFPDIERATLDSGIEVLLARRDAVPVVNLQLIFDAGYAADQHASPGTASLAMAMLDEGTEKLSALEISDQVATLGASLSAGSTLDTSYVALSALKNRLDESLDLFGQVVRQPSFPAEELERLRIRYLAQIEQEKTQPTSMALRVLPALMYGEGHAYAQPFTGSGTADSVGAITRDSLVDFHSTWFRPNNAKIVIAGDTTLDEIVPKLNQLFAGWEAADIPVKNVATVEPPVPDAIYLLDRPGAQQSMIFAGQLLPPKNNPDEIAIQTLNKVLGGLASARLAMNLREDKAWSYGAYSTISDARGQRPLFAYAPVQTDKTRESVLEIQKELTELGSTRPPAADELAKIQRNVTLSLPGKWETAGAVLGSLSALVEFNLDEDYWSTYADKVSSLTVEDMTRVAGEVIDPTHVTWVVVGDRAVIEEELAGLGYDKILRLDADGNVLSD